MIADRRKVGDINSSYRAPEVDGAYFDLNMPLSRQQYTEHYTRYKRQLKDKMVQALGDQEEWPQEAQDAYNQVTPQTFAGFVIGEDVRSSFGAPSNQSWTRIEVVDNVRNKNLIGLRLSWTPDEWKSDNRDAKQFPFWQPATEEHQRLKLQLTNVTKCGYLFIEGRESYYISQEKYKQQFAEGGWQRKMRQDAFYSYTCENGKARYTKGAKWRPKQPHRFYSFLVKIICSICKNCT